VVTTELCQWQCCTSSTLKPRNPQDVPGLVGLLTVLTWLHSGHFGT